MTVNTTPVEISYTGDASTTVFALPFAFAANAHVKVYLGGVLQGSGYSITGAGNPSGGTLTMTTAPGTGVALKARRVTPLTQDIDVVNNATVFASSLETGLDYALMRQQEEAFDRTALGVTFAIDAAAVAANAASAAADAGATAADRVQTGLDRVQTGLDRVTAQAAAAAAAAALNTVGISKTYDTKALATAAVGGLTNGDLVQVLVDESRSSRRTLYVVTAGALVFKLAVDPTPVLLAGTGLNVEVAAFKVTMADGEALSYAGSTVAVPASGTFYIGFDLYSGVVRALRYKANTGTVWLGKVTTSGSAVTAVVLEASIVVPPTSIPLTRAKIARPYQSVKIGLLGTSLVEGAGSGTFWHSLCFDSAYVADGFLVELGNSATVTVTNSAVGGQTAHHSLMQLGRSVYSAYGAYGSTQMTYSGLYGGEQAATPEASFAESPLFGMDLVIIGACANGGTENLSYLENVVKQLRSRGVEVIILTENYRSDNAAFLESNIPLLAQLAAAYGCELADTWSYMRATQDGGTPVLADVIHQNAAGHIAYAAAVRSVLNGQAQAAAVVRMPETRFMTPAQTLIAKKFLTRADIQFQPYTTTGAAVSSPVTTSEKNPAVAFGGKLAASNAVIELGVGEVAEYGHAFAHAVDIIVELNSAFTIEVTTQNTSTVLSTVVSASTALNAVVPLEGVTMGNYADISAGQPGFFNRGLQVKCTAGTARIVGACFWTWPSKEIPFSDMEFVGTWAQEAAVAGRAVSKYSDVDLDRVIIPFTGTAINVVMSGKDAAGKIDVWLDGRLISSAFDLRIGGDYVSPITVAADTDHFGHGYGDHVLMIKRNGAHASVAAAASGNRRLAILAAYALDGR